VLLFCGPPPIQPHERTMVVIKTAISEAFFSIDYKLSASYCRTSVIRGGESITRVLRDYLKVVLLCPSGAFSRLIHECLS